MEIEVTTTITKNDVFNYYLYSSFSGGFGIARLIISLGFLIGGIYSFGKTDLLASILLCFLGLLNPVITPVLFHFKSLGIEQQNKSYCYVFNENGFLINQEGKKKFLQWDKFSNIETFKRLIVMRIDRLNAFIVPRRVLSRAEEMHIRELIKRVKK